MKLKKLTMTAFGSYANTETIDFERLESSLYLVRGNTGAGKTTIFDAIVFALYGESSGGKRKLAMMHSDFVDLDVDTVVELEFEHQGGTHRVKREQGFTHHRDGRYDPKTPSAEFWEAGRPVIRGTKLVTDRITELLGLTSDQFGQIVMLAQGDFKKFLEANGDGRRQILSRIFDTSAYKGLSDRLDKAREVLAKERSADEEMVRQEIQIMRLPEDIDEETRTKLKPIDPQDADKCRVLRSPTFVADMMQQVEVEERKSQDLRKAHQVCHAAMETRMSEKTAAESQNARLDALERARKRKQELDARAEEMVANRDSLNRGEKAWSVRREEALKRRAESARAAAVEEENKATQMQSEAVKEHEGAVAQQQELAPKKKELEEAKAELAQRRAKLPDYQALSANSGQLETAKREQEKLLAKKDDLAGQITSVQTELEGYETELATLQGVEGEVEKARQEEETSAKQKRDFNECEQKAKAICGLEQDLDKEKDKLERLTAAAEKAMGIYSQQYSEFIAAQAGLMAGRLKETIQAQGFGICPVCGVRHTDAESATFAKLSESPCTEEMVKKSQEAQRIAEKARGDQQTCVETQKAKIEGEKENLQTLAQGVPACEGWNWENWSRAEDVAACKTALEVAVETAHVQLKTALGRRKRRDDVQTLVKNAEERREKLTSQQKQTELLLQNWALEATKCESKIDQLRAGLAFGTEQEAKADIAQREKQVAELERILQKASERVTTAEKNLAAANATREAAREIRETAVADVASATSAYEEALRKAGYEDETAYRQDVVLLPSGDAAAQEWIARLREKDTSYQNDCKHAKENLAALEEETRDFIRRDLAVVGQAYEDAKKETEDADRKASLMEGFVRDHRSLLERIAKTDARLTASEKAMKRLRDLATLAMGARGTGKDRLDFERYMLGDCLKNVLNQANAHLDTMSGGRYALVHRATGANMNAVAGLDIDVLDRMTGKTRPAETISGGEGFEASMSLALGLADVVRNYAGNVQLDSTFIDEGFGSLDGVALDKCMSVLEDLTHGERGSRQVGVISHVSEMENRIWPQIVVSFVENEGSSTSIKFHE